jgi:hypothetical protein
VTDHNGSRDERLESVRRLTSGQLAAELDDLGFPDRLKRVAYQGLAGAIVAALTPSTESDPAAILVQFLVTAGIAIERGPHWRVEATNHYTNEYAIIVGATAKARKGTSANHVRDLFERVEEGFARDHITAGLSSGEGLMWEIRDPIQTAVRHRDEQPDTGVHDKRLLLIEPEFSRVLRVCQRETNTLSALLREAWDGRNLRSLVKNAPLRVTRPHIGILGHITRAELQKEMSSTDLANGLGNRFLWVAAKRQQRLPFGGELDPSALNGLVSDLRSAVVFARQQQRIDMTAAASERWIAFYTDADRDQPGLLGALLARSEAHVRRLATLYALIDSQARVDLAHLDAAIEVWRYVEDSVRWIFGDRLGDPTADAIETAVATAMPDGLDRTELRDHFSRHRSAEIDRALGVLLRAGRIVAVQEKTGGRPHTVYRTFVASDASVASERSENGASSASAQGVESVQSDRSNGTGDW